MLSQSRETMGVLVGLVGSMLLAVLLLLGMTGGGFFLALVVLAMLPITLAFLSVESIMSHQMATVSEAPEISPVAAIAPAATRAVPWAVIAGAAGSVALLGVYLIGMTVLEGSAHTIGHIRGEWPVITGVMAAFGILVGFTVDAAAHNGLRGKALAIGVMGTGVSMVGLFACCTPHLTRFLSPQYVLPAATLAVQYSMVIAIIGLSANLVTSLAIRRADLQTASAP